MATRKTFVEVPQDPDLWMGQVILAEARLYTPFVGVTRRLLRGAFFWMDAPKSVENMERDDRRRLIDRTLRRLVRTGLLHVKTDMEPIQRRSVHGGERKHVLYKVSRYFFVSSLTMLQDIAKQAV